LDVHELNQSLAVYDHYGIGRRFKEIAELILFALAIGNFAFGHEESQKDQNDAEGVAQPGEPLDEARPRSHFAAAVHQQLPFFLLCVR